MQAKYVKLFSDSVINARMLNLCKNAPPFWGFTNKWWQKNKWNKIHPLVQRCFNLSLLALKKNCQCLVTVLCKWLQCYQALIVTVRKLKFQLEWCHHLNTFKSSYRFCLMTYWKQHNYTLVRLMTNIHSHYNITSLHVSHVICHMLCVTCNLKIKCFGQSGPPSC